MAAAIFRVRARAVNDMALDKAVPFGATFAC
jgi:hypothetical protein